MLFRNRPKRERNPRCPGKLAPRRPKMECLEERALLAGVAGWEFSVEGTDSAAFAAVVSDSDSNIYLASSFQGTIDADPGATTVELSARGGARGDAFLAKYTEDQQLIWARRFGGSDGDERVTEVELDSAGNVYVAGYFSSSSADFGGHFLYGEGGWDAYVAKLDSNGNFLWVRSFGGASSDVGWDIDVDDTGTVTVAGAFNGAIDLDPHHRKQLIRSSAGKRDAVVWRLDAEGKLLWTRTFGGTGSDEAFRVVTDAAGDLFVTGPFQDSVNFGTASDPMVLTSTTQGVSDTYILKLNSSGNTLWAQQVGGIGLVGASRLALGASGSIYTSGWFDETAVFDDGVTLTSASARDAYIARWAADGTFVWARQLTATGDIRPQRMLVDSEENVFVAGRFRGTGDFDPSAESELLAAPDSEFDGFVVQMASTGTLVDAHQYTGPGVVRTDDLVLDESGNLLVSGSFASTAEMPTGGALAGSALPSVFLNKINLAPGLNVSPISGLVTTEAGGYSEFEVVLDTMPADVVFVDVASSDVSEGAVSPTTLTFDATNWDQPQVVTVQGVDDSDSDGDIQYGVSLSVEASQDPGYAALEVVQVSLVNQDDEASPGTNSLYVADIGFQSRRGGKNWRVVIEVRNDSNGNGLADGADALMAGVQVTVHFGGRTLTGTTDANGIFRSDWIRDPGSGNHYANVVDLVLAGYQWDPLGLDIEDDTDGDGKPDDMLVI